jgi:hypothetical protein
VLGYDIDPAGGRLVVNKEEAEQVATQKLDEQDRSVPPGWAAGPVTATGFPSGSAVYNALIRRHLQAVPHRLVFHLIRHCAVIRAPGALIRKQY